MFHYFDIQNADDIDNKLDGIKIINEITKKWSDNSYEMIKLWLFSYSLFKFSKLFKISYTRSKQITSKFKKEFEKKIKEEQEEILIKRKRNDDLKTFQLKILADEDIENKLTLNQIISEIQKVIKVSPKKSNLKLTLNNKVKSIKTDLAAEDNKQSFLQRANAVRKLELQGRDYIFSTFPRRKRCSLDYSKFSSSKIEISKDEILEKILRFRSMEFDQKA